MTERSHATWIGEEMLDCLLHVMVKEEAAEWQKEAVSQTKGVQ